MAKFRAHKSSLLGGEISPTAFGRTDLPIYAAACKTLKNMIPMFSGGAYRRPGTMFDNNMGAVSAIYGPHIIPFQRSQVEGYIVEIGKTVNDTGYMNVNRPIGSSVASLKTAVVTDGVSTLDTASTCTVATTDIVTHSCDELMSYRKVRFTTTGTLPAGLSLNTTYWTIYINATTCYVATSLANAKAGTRVDVTDTGSGTHTITMVDAVPWEHATSLTTTFWYDEWRDIQYAQSADVMWLVHPNRKPRKLARGGVDLFTVREFDQLLTGTARMNAWPYQLQNSTATTMQASATTGEITIDSSVAYFDPDMVGGMIKIEDAGNVGAAMIMGYVNATQVLARVIATLPGTGAYTTWWESAWNNYRGWPRTVCFWNDRLAMGGSASFPDTVWFSELSDYDQFSVAAEVSPYESNVATDSFAIQILSEQVNLIQWMSPEKSLAVGTIGDEYLIDREFTTSGFAWNNAQVLKQSSYGSAHTPAVRVGNELIFCQADEEEIRSFIFNFNEDSYVAEPLQTLYDEFPYPDDNRIYNGNRKIRGFHWDKSRSTLWCYDTKGRWKSLTRDRRLGVNAWASHELGGYDEEVPGSAIGVGSAATVDPVYVNPTGSVVSMCLLPNLESRQQDLWMVVYRKVNGTFRFYLEKMTGKSNIGFESAYGDGYSSFDIFAQTDCSFWDFNEYPAAEDYSFANLSHLEGETPVGTARGQNGWFYVTGSAVSGGATTLQQPYPGGLTSGAMALVWGYNYTSIVEPLRLEAGSQIGSAQAAIKRVHDVTIRFYKTLAAKVGRDANNLEQIKFRDGDTPMGKSPEFFTGDKKIHLDSEHDRDAFIYLIQDRPLPFAVISITSEGFTFD